MRLGLQEHTRTSVTIGHSNNIAKQNHAYRRIATVPYSRGIVSGGHHCHQGKLDENERLVIESAKPNVNCCRNVLVVL